MVLTKIEQIVGSCDLLHKMRSGLGEKIPPIDLYLVVMYVIYHSKASLTSSFYQC